MSASSRGRFEISNRVDSATNGSGKADWTSARKDVILPENAVHAGAVLLIGGTGEAWMGDVTVQS